MNTEDKKPWWPRWADTTVATGVLLFVVLLSLFPLRNNDIWWHLAVGKILAGGSFITEDPFMFSVPGLAWVPHAWLSSLFFYAVYSLTSEAGLVVLRALLVGTTFWFLLRLVKRFGIQIVFAAPVVLIAVLNAHSRFILRPHLFEHLFIMVLLFHLVASGRHRGARFYVLPVLLQLCWVNMHASFYLGPAIVALFFAGEGLANRFGGRFATIDGGQAPVAWKRVGLLMVSMVLVCFATPRPIAFLLEPLSTQQRELLTRYTLEWQSPFAPLARGAAFHPYYEILLAFLAVALLLSLRRLRPAAWLLIGFFAALSLEAHRFRVELALVGVPLALAQLRDVSSLRRVVAGSGGRWRNAAAVAASGVLAMIALGRVELGSGVADRFPRDAFEFVREHDVARRPFHTVGFGSYLIWDLYPERRTFVDGRNIDASIYRDFLACQSTSAGFNAVCRKYELDAFIIPPPEKSDGGMRNLHGFLVDADGWSLVHIDRNAFVYVKQRTVDAAWLDRHVFRYYHPMVFGQARFSETELPALEAELDRAAADDPHYARAGLDRARFLAGVGRTDEALAAVETLLGTHPENEEAVALRRQLGGI